MKKGLAALVMVLSFGAMFALPVSAKANTLGTCLVDALNGKERKQLVKWIYFAIAAHPEMQSFAIISIEDRTNTDKCVAGLITRLLTEECGSQLRTAQEDDPKALEKAFEFVGQVAMQELMTDKAVETSISGYAKYVDFDKIKAVLTK